MTEMVGARTTTTTSKEEKYRGLWRRAYEKAKSLGLDPWAEYALHELPAEVVRRHRYEVSRKEWTSDTTLAKMEAMPFAKGGLRRCYRVKKLSQQPNRPHVHPLNWRFANCYVCKEPLSLVAQQQQEQQQEGGEGGSRWFEAIKREVEMQQYCGEIGRVFDTLKPPKQVTIVDCFCLEFVNRGRWFLCERYLDGGSFEKHNGNLGSVDTDRLTPQAFSAASFWLASGTALVCDVQGVGDLYTDPCLHTLTGGSGSGDLGPRGMALFFESLDCTNPLLDLLHIPKFQLSPSQKRRRRCLSSSNKTTSVDLWRSARRQQDAVESSFVDLTNDDLDAVEAALDAADRKAATALQSLLADPVDFWSKAELAVSDSAELSPPDRASLRKVNFKAVARVHAAMAELETEGFFFCSLASSSSSAAAEEKETLPPKKIDAAAAVFHCAKAAFKGNAAAAHALARWHADLPSGLVPQFSNLKYAYPNKAGALLALAAQLGDPEATAELAAALLVPRWGLPLRADVAESCLEAALKVARLREEDPDFLRLVASVAPGDHVVVAVTGVPHKASVLRVNDDGTLDVVFKVVESSGRTTQVKIPWSRLVGRGCGDDDTGPGGDDQYALPTATAGADLPPRHRLLSLLADLRPDDTIRLLQLAKQAALDLRASASFKAYDLRLDALLSTTSSENNI